MKGHQQHTASRAGLGTLIVGIVLSLMAFGISPAQAAGATPAGPAKTTHQQTTPAPTGRPCGPGANLHGGVRAAARCAVDGPAQMSEGGCGFLQRCIYFSRSEQTILLSGGSAAIVAAICTASFGIGCVAASGIVGAALQWLNNRGGICPTSKPKLRVQYFPVPQVEGCVA